MSSTTYSAYAGKLRTSSNIAWHRPVSTSCRVDAELKEKSAHALRSTTDPLEKLRLLCFMRGACGILDLGRFLHTMDDGSQHFNKEKFFTAIKETGLDISDEEIEQLFSRFAIHNSGIRVDEFIKHVRPPMSEGRRAIVEQAFRKLRKSEDGTIFIEDLRRAYSVNANSRYKSGEETEDVIMKKFLNNFETDGIVDGKVTLEEFMNYYSGISVSVENDCSFDLMMRQAFKL